MPYDDTISFIYLFRAEKKIGGAPSVRKDKSVLQMLVSTGETDLWGNRHEGLQQKGRRSRELVIKISIVVDTVIA